MYTEWSYLICMVTSVVATVWVAQLLQRNGRVFLMEIFLGKQELADSVNHLLVAAFYLINIGWLTVALQYGAKPETLRDAIEFLSTKIGLVLFVLGGMHFMNLYMISRPRWRALIQSLARPVEPPEALVGVGRPGPHEQSLARPVKPQEPLTSAGGPGPQEQQIARPVGSRRRASRQQIARSG